MSPTYLVENATKKKEIEGRNGPLAIYELQLKDGEGSVTCEVAQMVTTAAPYAGQSVEGTIDHSGPFGAKFKKASKGAAGGGNAGFQRDPKETASIVRQHSQHMAILWCSILERKGRLTDEAVSPSGLAKLIDFFMLDAQNGAERAPPKPGEGP